LVESKIAALLLYSGLAMFAAVSDIRTRAIPNYLNAIIALGGLASVLILGGTGAALSATGHFAVALAIGLLVYALGMWGGGDAKFYAASSAWFALSELPRLVVGISLGGLLLLIVWFTIHRLSGKAVRNTKLPYGVAIAAGGIVTMVWLAVP
jgi:prepilin peptidase CpaA